MRKIEIIAEIAQGYLGDYNLCKTYIEASARAGATTVKFQLVYADELATQDYKHYDLFKSLEIDFKKWVKLKKISNKFKIDLCFDIFGTKSLSIAEKLGVRCIKIHPTDLTNYNFLNKINQSKIKKIILGVGGFKEDTIMKALKIVHNKKNSICIMYGFQGYPTLSGENQLYRIKLLQSLCKNYKNISYGFADHTLPDQKNNHLASILAVGMGCLIIEKHLTLSKVLKMEDFESAYNPDEFKDFVSIVEEAVEIINLNTPNSFKLTKKEKNYSSLIVRNYIAKKKINKSTILQDEMFDLKRSSNLKAIKSSLKISNKILKKI